MERNSQANLQAIPFCQHYDNLISLYICIISFCINIYLFKHYETIPEIILANLGNPRTVRRPS